MDRFWLASYSVAWLMVVAQGLTLGAMLWMLGRIHLKKATESRILVTGEGPRLHAVMPEFEGRDMEGHPIRASDYHGRRVVLLLMSPRCEPCEQVGRSLPLTQRGLRDCPEFVLVMEGSRQEAQDFTGRYRLRSRMIVDEEANIRTGLGVDRTPYGFLIDEDGVVRMKGVVDNGERLEGLIAERGRHLPNMVWETSAE